MELPFIRFDCKHFLGYKPCFANKNHGVFCQGCSYYEKDSGINEPFPDVKDIRMPESSNVFRKILIIKLDASGDVLRTTSILPSLKKHFPNSSVNWITKEKSFSFLKNNPFIDHIVADHDVKDLFHEVFDIAINLDSGPESCSLMSKINSEYKFGYHLVMGKPYPINSLAFEWYLMGVNDAVKKSNEKTYHKIIHEICDVKYEGSSPILTVTPEIIERSRQMRERYNLERYDEFILVNLGGGERWQYKKWTKEGYSELVKKLLKKNFLATGIVAGSDDKKFYDEVSSNIPEKDNLLRIGCLESAEEFISLIYLADRVLTSDSLGFHISTALGKYTVCFTGPTSYKELDIFGKGKIIYSDKVDCLCCYLNKCDKIINCMNSLDVEYVYNELMLGV